MSQKPKSHLSRLRCQKTCSRRRGSPAKNAEDHCKGEILVKQKTKVGGAFFFTELRCYSDIYIYIHIISYLLLIETFILGVQWRDFN